LIKLGADIQMGHRAENLTNADVLVYSSAVHKDNPEIIAACKKTFLLSVGQKCLVNLLR